ncbi:MAG: DMT family transporter [Acidobacteria bacterium]|nr:DMT family transporter [Acidobacteriota bacterium]
MIRIILYTAAALVAFAFNSILCRLALRGEEADAIGFTLVRITSGAVALVLISLLMRKPERQQGPHSRRSALGQLSLSRFRVGGAWPSAFFLFTYAICFSLAYLSLSAGTGALILFGSVQLTMIAVSLFQGERPRPLEWLGLFIAAGGLAYLLLPGFESPPLVAAASMAAAGASWGLYSLRGRGAADPIANTTGNFARAVPMIILAAMPFFTRLHLTPRGWLLAAVSGAVTSGIGYSFWYAALKFHTAIRAAVLQLPVPLLTAFLGVLLLGETASVRLWVASALVLGGIGLTIFSKQRVAS